ncbi:MAG: SEC-C domain-containing protein [bacterium]
MPPGRNDPCPCNSGKKYKHCCAARDSRAAPMLHVMGSTSLTEIERTALNATRTSVPWQADVAPVTTSVENRPDARFAAIILGTHDVVLTADLDPNPPSTAIGVARLLAHAIEAQIKLGATPPSSITVRHQEVAAALAPLVEPIGVNRVHASTKMPELDEMLHSLRSHITGLPDPVPGLSHPETWAAWQLPPDLVANLFRAAAAYYTAAPWINLSGDEPLRVTIADGSTWFVSIMGQAGQVVGVAMYESLAEFESILVPGDTRAAFNAFEHVLITLDFDARADLPKAMRNELATRRLPVAGPAAYPSIWTRNTIGGGIAESQVRDLIAILDAVAAMPPLAIREALVDWTHQPTGITIRSEGALGELPPLWAPPDRLTLSQPTGVNAEPGAECTTDFDVATHLDDEPILARFVASVGSEEGINATKRHLKDQAVVWRFVLSMNVTQRTPLRAVTEYDLRVYLYDIYPRSRRSGVGEMREVRAGLKRFFAYLHAHEGLSYPWAASILRDREAFEVRWDTTPPDNASDDAFDDWIAEFLDDLHWRVMLPDPNLGTVGRGGHELSDKEFELVLMLQRNWMIWREELIANGNTDPESVRAELETRRAEWERMPQEPLGGKSPAAVLTRRRAKRR